MAVKRLSENPSDACICHSEPFGRLRTGSAKRGIVILSPALGGTKDLEILRLTPQNDVVGRPLNEHCHLRRRGNMEASKVEVIRWSGNRRPDEATIRQILAEEGLHGYRWSNAPGDVYSAHSHSYNKVIHVVSGSITFGLPASGEKVILNPGNRLNLPAGVSHNAVVGPEGVSCIEAHR